MNAAKLAVAVSTLLVVGALTTVGPEAARKVEPGDVYKSKGKVFEVTVPKGCSPFKTYEVQEGSRKGSEAFEEVVFFVRDMGEVYHAGVRALTPSMRAEVRLPEGPLGRPHLAWWGVKLHLGGREATTGGWRPRTDPEAVTTPHGSGVLSANWVEGGQFLEILKIENGKTTRQQGPGLIVVLVVQQGERLIYVTGQADASGGVFEAASQPEKVTPDCIQGRLHEMMQSLRITRPLDPRS